MISFAISNCIKIAKEKKMETTGKENSAMEIDQCLESTRKTEFEPPLETTLYRQSMNFWNTMQDRKMSPNLRRLVMDKLRSTDGCKYRELEHPPSIQHDSLFSRFK